MTPPALEPMLRVQRRGLVECTRWHDGQWWFADWAAGEILTPGDDGTATAVVQGAALPLSFDFLPDGSLLFVSSRDGRLVRRASDGTLDGICIDAEGCVWYADVPHQCCVRVCEGGEVDVAGAGWP